MDLELARDQKTAAALLSRALISILKLWVPRIKSGEKNGTLSKIDNFCSILMKLGENNHLMLQSFSVSFIRLEKTLWKFTIS